MSTTKTYNVLVKAEKQTDPIKDVVKEFSELRSILLLVNLPFRIYHSILRMTGTLQKAVGDSAAAATPELTTESGAFDIQTESIDLTNQSLANYIALMAVATEGASLAGAAGALGLAGQAIAGAGVVSGLASLQAPEGGGSIITHTGMAMVHAGEYVGRGGGGMGDVNINISNLILSPEGDSLTDFTSRMGDQLRMALRSFTRDLPT